MRLRFAICSALILFAVAGVPKTQAGIVYDNSGGSGTNAYYSTFEYGDEIILAGTQREMTQFKFEYYGDFLATGTETARIRIYKNDGPDTHPAPNIVAPAPGTVLFDSGPFPISPGYQTKSFDGLKITVPKDVTWTVQFAGLVGGTGDEAGLILRAPPTTGSSYDDFWMNSGGSWQLFTWHGSPVADFAARIIAGGQPTNVGIQRGHHKVVVQWNDGSTLQAADSINGPFTNVQNATSPFEFDTTTGNYKFWRLQAPQ